MSWITPTLTNRLIGLPKKTQGPLVKRAESCSFCSANEGHLVSKGQFWDLSSINFIRCPECDLVQMDPMLSDEIMSVGCYAYYLQESNRESAKNLNKNRLRSFRRGVYFGLRLKKLKIQPKQILEIGPGDGFFSRGVQYVFPKSEFTCLDIVPDVIQNIQSIHGFKGKVGTLESLNSKAEPQYDLIIARDIIEHLSKPNASLEKISALLKPSGFFHFITPNGYEDIWAAYCCWQTSNIPCEVVLNHVNYFPAQSLERKLNENKLYPIEHFIYDFNGTRWGQARKIKKELGLPAYEGLSAKETIQKYTSKNKKDLSDLKSPVNSWLFRFRSIGFIYCIWKEHFKLKLKAKIGIGHEIYGLFQKKT